MEPLATSLITDIEKRVGDSTEALLANADVLLMKGQSQEAKQLLEQGLKKDPENRLLRRALQSSSTTREPSLELKESELEALSVPQLKNLCEIALNRPLATKQEDLEDKENLEKLFTVWDDEVARFEKQLRKMEGETGTEWRYIRARRLLAKSSIDPDLDLSEAVEIGGYLDRQRPQWSSTHTLLGTVADLQKNPTQAIREYTRAIQLGAQDLRIFERLAELLYQQGMITEASALIDRLGSRASVSRRLSSIALTLSSNRESDLLSLAKEGTELRPKDPMSWIWYSQVLESSSRGASASDRSKSLEDARISIDRAKEVARGNDLRVVNAEFAFLLATRDDKKMDQLIESIKTDPNLTEAEKWPVIAQFYSARGDAENAIPAYRRAIQLVADSGEIGRRLAQILVAQGKRDEAINELTSLSTANPKDSDTRRALAALLAARGNEKDWQAVDKLLANSALDTTADDKRLRSELLAQKGSPGDLAQAQFIMESVVEDPLNRTDSDRFRLASLYLQNAQYLQLQTGKEKQVNQLLESAERQLKLATASPQSPLEFLYAYADFLIEQKQISEARSIYDRMNTQSAEEFPTVLMKARLLSLDGKSGQASKELEDWLTAKKSALPRGYTPTQMAEILSLAGQGMQIIGSSARAEELLRESYELDSRAGINYVRSLARTNNNTARENAIRFLLKRSEENTSSESTRMLASLLSVGETSPELLENAERLLKRVSTSNESDLNLLLSVADYWLSKNKQSDAIEIYRRIIQLRPNDVVALNNIANLLAENPGAIDEALGYSEKALQIAGRQPLLLDTKAVLLMNGGRTAEAIPVLEMAIASSNDPRLMLHMYIALSNVNRTVEAERVLTGINLNSLNSTLLTPSDQRELSLLLERKK